MTRCADRLRLGEKQVENDRWQLLRLDPGSLNEAM